ncbi:putative glycosyltransferase [Streptomyces sp. Tu6071]|nr:putative glycosyltransferase [Streptomyces sp. Tu6071]
MHPEEVRASSPRSLPSRSNYGSPPGGCREGGTPSPSPHIYARTVGGTRGREVTTCTDTAVRDRAVTRKRALGRFGGQRDAPRRAGAHAERPRARERATAPGAGPDPATAAAPRGRPRVPHRPPRPDHRPPRGRPGLADGGDPRLAPRYRVASVQAPPHAGPGELPARERALDRAEQVRGLAAEADENGDMLRFQSRPSPGERPMPLPRIGVVVVTMGTRPGELDALLASVARQDVPAARVVLVGNATPLGDVVTEATKVPLAENLGCPGGRNVALELLRDSGDVDVVVELDDDGLLVADDVFRQVRRLFAEDPGLGIVGFRVADEHGHTERRWALSSHSRRRPEGGRAASGACSRRAAPRPSYWTYLGLGAVRRECVHGVARQTGM